MKRGPEGISFRTPYYGCKVLRARLADLGHVSDVRGRRLAVGLDAHASIAGGCHGELALMDIAELLGGLDRLHDGAVDGALGDGGEVRLHAPVHDHLLDGPLVTRERADGHVGTEVRDQACRTAGGGGDGDALGADGGSHVDSGKAHDVVDGARGRSALGHHERSVCRQVLLGLVGDAGLHLHGLDRVHAGRGLAGEHDGVGAVVDGVGNVGNLGARRARVVLHGVEHLCSGDNGLVGLVALADDLLLDVGHRAPVRSRCPDRRGRP